MRSISYLISGNVFAQAISFATIPLVARFFGPEAFGLAGAFAALAAICIQVSTLSYPLAIVLPRSDVEAGVISTLSALASVATSTIVVIILLIGADAVASGLNLELAKNFLWVIPILMIIGGLYSILDQWANRLGFFGAKAISTSISSIIISSLKVIAGIVHPTPSALVVANSSTSLVQAIALISWRKIRFPISKISSNRVRTLRRIAWRYRDFALFRAPEQFLNVLTQGLPILLFGAFYGPALTGQLALALAALNTPANMVGKAVVDVAYPALSRQAQDGIDLTPSLLKLTSTIFTISALPALALLVLAQPIFTVIFGQEWAAAGHFAQLLCIWTLVMVSNKPAMAAIPVLGAQRNLLLYTIVSTPLRVAAMYISHIIYQDPVLTVLAFSLMSAGLNFALIIYVFILNRLRNTAESV